MNENIKNFILSLPIPDTLEGQLTVIIVLSIICLISVFLIFNLSSIIERIKKHIKQTEIKRYDEIMHESEKELPRFEKRKF